MSGLAHHGSGRLSRRLALKMAVLLPVWPALAGAAQLSSNPTTGAPGGSTDPLPSWRAGEARRRILAFLEAVTTEGRSGYVPPEQRIAVFDNDGTLWSEQPMYVQLAFAIDRARALLRQQQELAASPVIAAAASGDGKAVMALGSRGVLELVAQTHAGMSTEDFALLVRRWIHTARHPVLGVPYTQLIYQPMLELLALLRSRGFRTWIVSGGGVDFLRVFAEETYGIPPEQVIGSSIQLRYGESGGEPELLRLPEIDFIDDGDGKPVAIHRQIGRRPIAAFGNSDGDLAMLRWTTAGPGERLGLIVHHDDGEREVAYDRLSAFGKLDVALDQAGSRGWTVVSMRRDWGRVFAGAARVKPGRSPKSSR